MKKFYVYVHTCNANGKRYVGCTTQARPEFRWAEGKGYQNNDHFYRAILKYGWSNFQHEVFEVESEEEMYRKEVELISFYHSNDPRYGYNHSSGGEKSASGCIRSEESRKKQSEDNLKRWADPEYRKRVSETIKERCNDPEVRRKRSEIQKKVHSDPEYRRKMSEAAKKSHSDPEYRKKISEAAKNRWSDPELRRKMSKARKGKPQPKVKISLPDGTVLEISKQNLSKYYINKGKEFEYVS